MPTQTNWHIPGLLPAGELLTLDGPPRVGKTLLATHWTAELSKVEGQRILYLHDIGQTEAALTFLASAGYNRERVVLRQLEVPDAEPDTRPACIFPHLLTQLRQKVDEYKPTIVIVDGFDDLLDAGPDVNPHEARRLWRELYDFVMERDITVLLTRVKGLHETRPTGNLTKAALRVVHHGLTMGWYPCHEEQRVIAVAHNQFGKTSAQFHMSISDHGAVEVKARHHSQRVKPAKSPSPWQYHQFREQRLAACVDLAVQLIAGQALHMNVLIDALAKLGFTKGEINQALARGNFGLRTDMLDCYVTPPAHFEKPKQPDMKAEPSTLPAPRLTLDFKRKGTLQPLDEATLASAREHTKSISSMMLRRTRHPESPTLAELNRNSDALMARIDGLLAKANRVA
jgi:KaiC/GvpD/RAD55 family RecA-like ATPase